MNFHSIPSPECKMDVAVERRTAWPNGEKLLANGEQLRANGFHPTTEEIALRGHLTSYLRQRERQAPRRCAGDLGPRAEPDEAAEILAKPRRSQAF